MARGDVKYRIIVDSSKGTAGLKKFKIAQDKATKAMKKQGLAAGQLKSRMHSLYRGIIMVAGAYGLMRLAKSFLHAADTAEQYALRLKILLRSSEEGAKVFKSMADYAARVPHTYQDIMASAVQLAGVMKGGRKEIEEWMPLIGDLAAATGLNIQVATEQVIRMLSAGAASARLFRVRGVLNMLGFQAGVAYSTEQTRKQLIRSWKDVNSKFRGATEQLATSWKGLTSMMSDKWFKFRTAVMDSGPFKALEYGISLVNKRLNAMIASGEFEKFAEKVGNAVTTLLENIVVGTGKTIDLVAPLFKITMGEFRRLWDYYMKIPPWIREVGLIAALFGGVKGKLLVGSLLHLTGAFIETFQGLQLIAEKKMTWKEFFAGTSEFRKRLHEIQQLDKEKEELLTKGPTQVKAGFSWTDIFSGDATRAAKQLVKEFEELRKKTNEIVKKKPTALELIPDLTEYYDQAKALAGDAAAARRVEMRKEIQDVQDKFTQIVGAARAAAGREIDVTKYMEEAKRKIREKYAAMPLTPLEQAIKFSTKEPTLAPTERTVRNATQCTLKIRKEFNEERLALEKQYDDLMVMIYGSAEEKKKLKLKQTIEDIDKKYDKLLEKYKGRKDLEVMIHKMAEAEKAKATKESTEERIKAEKEAHLAALGNWQTMLGEFSSLYMQMAQAGMIAGKKYFGFYKALSIAEALIATWKAFDEQLSKSKAQAYATLLLGLAKVELIRAQKPPSFDVGGVSKQPGIYYAGVPEAHIPLKGGAVPVVFSGGLPASNSGVTIDMRGTTFLDQDTLHNTIATISAGVARAVAPQAVYDNYKNDGTIRKLILYGD